MSRVLGTRIFFFFKSCIWKALGNKHSAQEPVQSCQTGEESQSTVSLSLGRRMAAMEWLSRYFQLIYNLIPHLTLAPICLMLVFLGYPQPIPLPLDSNMTLMKPCPIFPRCMGSEIQPASQAGAGAGLRKHAGVYLLIKGLTYCTPWNSTQQL